MSTNWPMICIREFIVFWQPIANRYIVNRSGMHLSRILWLIVFSLGAAVAGRAQSAQDIVNKYLQAMGGKEKLQSINSLYQEGIAVLENGAQLSSRSWRVYDRVYRQEVVMPAGKVVIVVTPKQGWSAGPGTGGV